MPCWISIKNFHHPPLAEASLTNSHDPSNRYVIGGVLEDKSYTNEVWEFTSGDGEYWMHRREITVSGSDGDSENVMQVTIDTEAGMWTENILCSYLAKSCGPGINLSPVIQYTQ